MPERCTAGSSAWNMPMRLWMRFEWCTERSSVELLHTVSIKAAAAMRTCAFAFAVVAVLISPMRKCRPSAWTASATALADATSASRRSGSTLRWLGATSASRYVSFHRAGSTTSRWVCSAAPATSATAPRARACASVIGGAKSFGRR